MKIVMPYMRCNRGGSKVRQIWQLPKVNFEDNHSLSYDLRCKRVVLDFFTGKWATGHKKAPDDKVATATNIFIDLAISFLCNGKMSVHFLLLSCR